MMEYGSQTDELAAAVLAHVKQTTVNLGGMRQVVAGRQGTAALLINLRGAVRELDAALTAAVALERSRGASWTDIGLWLGMSKQAAWQRFGATSGK